TSMVMTSLSVSLGRGPRWRSRPRPRAFTWSSMRQNTASRSSFGDMAALLSIGWVVPPIIGGPSALCQPRKVAHRVSQPPEARAPARGPVPRLQAPRADGPGLARPLGRVGPRRQDRRADRFELRVRRLAHRGEPPGQRRLPRRPEARVGPREALRPQRRRGPAVHPPRVPRGLDAGRSPDRGARAAPSEASFSVWPGSCPQPDYARDAVRSTGGGTTDRPTYVSAHALRRHLRLHP